MYTRPDLRPVFYWETGHTTQRPARHHFNKYPKIKEIVKGHWLVHTFPIKSSEDSNGKLQEEVRLEVGLDVHGILS